MPVNQIGETPNASRVHIAVFGRRNSGKSSLINAITGQETALVSDVAGTTTDPVYKPMELSPIGPCVFIDTAGFDDVGELGSMRVRKTEEILDKTDLCIMVITAGQQDFSFERSWIAAMKTRKIPVVIAVNKIDCCGDIPEFVKAYPFVAVSALLGQGIDMLKEKLAESAPGDFELLSITSHLAGKGDHVLLVAPQDIQAPKGRLILAQVQTIRDLLDNRACVTVVTADELAHVLTLFKAPPTLIITDSQVFNDVYDRCPQGTRLTSFSVLLARYKGDIKEYMEGVKAVDSLTEQDKVLILEACTHNALDEDIGRVKIPALLRKKVGENLTVEVCSGNQIPEDLTGYHLAIHCGGCMFNRTHVLSRISRCKQQGVPVTNYGLLLAKLGGILDKIVVE